MFRKEDEKIKYLMNIIINFDKFSEKVEYVFKKNYRLKDYEYILHKLNENIIYMYLYHNKIEIEKKCNRKFIVRFNISKFQTIAERRRLENFTAGFKGKLRIYYILFFKGKAYFNFKNFGVVIRRNKPNIELEIIRKVKRYYLTLPDLEEKELPESEYGYPIYGDILYLHKINGIPYKELKERFGNLEHRMPYFAKVKMRNIKIEYQFFRMLIKKGIMKLRNPHDYDIKEHLSYIQTFDDLQKKALSKMLRILDKFNEFPIFTFTNLIEPDYRRLTGGRFPDFRIIVLQDYDYDNVNQVLLKFIEPDNESYLCGVDYKNTLWCMRLPAITLKYPIKSVYKFLYNLDKETKIFEF
ncbi:hypothetical protein AFV9_gp22 [Betalipothrixvirus uzonense]|uniref:Uncharacterized protein n=1 Tax=Betalipothrixvirus uzonense TaxID=512792 RepID=B2CRJ9_9VIRU|nr:hypothetical protein AFV9_gp22 [Acidianus filamentous virus 9]ACB37256.1 hypothetical protein [Acidianus filamentous virus 9]